MEQLWAPWRSELISAEKRSDCIFCAFPAESRDRENLIVARSELSFVILNRFPYNNGHLMVIPRRHLAELTDLTVAESADLSALLQKSITILRRLMRPDGFNLGMNLGAAAGAGIAGHLHWHVVPRWSGDTNFMPVLGQTKVMIDHLLANYDALTPLFAATT
jgi:ATP adenylyltransferase